MLAARVTARAKPMGPSASNLGLCWLHGYANISHCAYIYAFVRKRTVWFFDMWWLAIWCMLPGPFYITFGATVFHQQQYPTQREEDEEREEKRKILAGDATNAQIHRQDPMQKPPTDLLGQPITWSHWHRASPSQTKTEKKYFYIKVIQFENNKIQLIYELIEFPAWQTN